MTTDFAPTPTRTVRPWFVVAAVTVAVVVIAGLGYHRWDRATIHGATPLFSRTTTDGVHIEVERGDVRIQRTICPSDGTWSSACEKRVPGYAVRLSLVDGETGGTTLPQDIDPEREPAFDPPAHVVVSAGLGIPPGSVDQQFIVVHALARVALVRATRPDGSIDEMTPVDGVAVLATRTGWRSLGHVEAFDADRRPLDVS